MRMLKLACPLLFAATLALAAPAMAQRCVNFEPYDPSGPWPCCGVTFTFNAVDFTTEPFIDVGGAPILGGWADNINACNGMGGYSLWLSNVTTRVDVLDFFPATGRGPSIVRFYYRDYGGSVNLRVNGILANTFVDFHLIPAGYFLAGNVKIVTTATWTGSYWEGTVTLKARRGYCIEDLAIGGQELCIDDLCARKCKLAAADMNGDGQVDDTDVDAFVLAIADPDEFARRFPQVDILGGDFDDDGAVTIEDIDAFVDELSEPD